VSFVGPCLGLADLGRWIPNIVNSFVHAENVSLAHLLHERAILTSPGSASGRAYTVTDAGTAPKFEDLYNLCALLTGFKVTYIPSVLMLFLAYMVEAYTVARWVVPGLKVLPEPKGDIAFLQPGLWNITGSHQVATNDQAALSVEEGGIGYEPGCTSIEGMCQEARQWNDEEGVKGGEDGLVKTVVKEVKNMAKTARVGA
jgi:hypothetical protein